MGKHHFGGIGLNSEKRRYLLRKSLRKFKKTKVNTVNHVDVAPLQPEIEKEVDNDESLTAERGFPFCGLTTQKSGLENKSSNHFLDSLRQLAVSHGISHVLLNEILKLLKTHGCFQDFPSDARTFLHTDRKKVVVRQVFSGKYYHFGIENGIKRLLQHCSIINEKIELQVNIDGLPLAKSSGSQFYPILGCLTNNLDDVFLIGLYWGYEKPHDSNELLEEFVCEAANLVNHGIVVNKNFYSVRITALVCDAPAKSFCLKVKGHTGYSSCTKCIQEGEYIHGTVCFPLQTNGVHLRTNEDFVMQTDEDHHMGVSVLLKIPHFNAVDNVPLDGMHLIDLGVMKKLLLKLWISGKPPNKLSKAQVEIISQNILEFKKSFPNEFARRPRGLAEVKRWKATEFRVFLLYLGPIVLKDVLPKKMYNNFMDFHVSIYILRHITLHDNKQKMIKYANDLLMYFIKIFSELYGDENISHNIHNLLHISPDVQRHGAIDDFSSYKFENYLQILKKKLRKGSDALPQIVKRIQEENEISDISTITENKMTLTKKFLHEHNQGPILGKPNKQYKELQINNVTLKANGQNSFCQLKNNMVIQIKNFVQFNEDSFVLGLVFVMEDLYMKPCKSSYLGIYKGHLLSKQLRMWPISDMKCKVVGLKKDSTFFLFATNIQISS